MDALGISVIDFKNSKKSELIYSCDIDVKTETDNIYFDLASLTKPLSNSLARFLSPEAFDPIMDYCLSHRGGLPSWGLLSTDSWKSQILSYPVKESETLYSDFSALRVMLELEKKGIDQKKLCSTVWDKELVYWLDLPQEARTLQCGYKNSLPNFGQVHDPNAWTLKTFCSHAGLFSTVGGISRTLLAYQEKTDFISKVKADLKTHGHRFSFGWDRVTNPQDTLAGKGCGAYTFGHLGFTGTSVWIDPDKLLGHVILSNTVKHHWYDKQNLNDIRRAIGELVWAGEA